MPFKYCRMLLLLFCQSVFWPLAHFLLYATHLLLLYTCLRHTHECRECLRVGTSFCVCVCVCVSDCSAAESDQHS